MLLTHFAGLIDTGAPLTLSQKAAQNCTVLQKM